MPLNFKVLKYPNIIELRKSTISRRLNNRNEKVLNQLLSTDESYQLESPEYVGLDIDSNYIQTHGNQENKAFNQHYKNHIKPEYRIIRWDSGYVKSELYRLAEKNNTDYTIRLKANKKLYDKAHDLTENFLKNIKMTSL